MTKNIDNHPTELAPIPEVGRSALSDDPLLRAHAIYSLIRTGLPLPDAINKVEKLISLTFAARAKRSTEARVNAAYLRNSPDNQESTDQTDEAMLPDSIRPDIPEFLVSMALLAPVRFADPTHNEHLDKNDSIAFGIGHCDQFGDWGAPAELDEAIQSAISAESLRVVGGVDSVEVVHHDLDQARYQFYRSDDGRAGLYSCLAVRKRPIADIKVTLEDGTRVTVEVFRRSTFLMTGEDPEASAYLEGAVRATHAIEKYKAKPKSVPENTADTLALPPDEQFSTAINMLEKALLSPDRDKGSSVLPCSTTYTARVRGEGIIAAPEEDSIEPEILSHSQGLVDRLRRVGGAALLGLISRFPIKGHRSSSTDDVN